MQDHRQATEKLLAHFRKTVTDRLHIEDIEVEHEPALRAGLRGDLGLGITIKGKKRNVLVAVKRHAFPRDIEGVRKQLKNMARSDSRIDHVMVWAESLSDGARRELEASGIGYFDGSGSLSIHLGSRQILIDRPPLKPKWKDVASMFTPERCKVLHQLLLHWSSWHTGTGLSEASGASPNTVSVLMRELEKRGMVQGEGKGRSVRRQLTAPGDLLDAWAQYWAIRAPRKTRWFAFAQNPAALPALLAQRMEEGQLNPTKWAFTGQYAANSLSPLLTSINGYELIVPLGEAEFVAESLELKSVDRGANVTLTECDEFALQHRLNLSGKKGWFASPVVQYLDLVNSGGRSEELAAELKKEVLMGRELYV